MPKSIALNSNDHKQSLMNKIKSEKTRVLYDPISLLLIKSMREFQMQVSLIDNSLDKKRWVSFSQQPFFLWFKINFDLKLKLIWHAN